MNRWVAVMLLTLPALGLLSCHKGDESNDRPFSASGTYQIIVPVFEDRCNYASACTGTFLEMTVVIRDAGGRLDFNGCGPFVNQGGAQYDQQIMFGGYGAVEPPGPDGRRPFTAVLRGLNGASEVIEVAVSGDINDLHTITSTGVMTFFATPQQGTGRCNDLVVVGGTAGPLPCSWDVGFNGSPNSGATPCPWAGFGPG